ncbi:helix-turn-helix transcriptional regulator [Agrobacterium tumefaciens]|uniref:helix-turn-helix transcriptional regulator n=1 Tax=Agrobacterium tumefaciens TaxID=358 RepID=UPI002243831A|nr:LuxR family transcriptional regulator [Agrobacterium tumefaciens]MCW8060093.1 LuxR family transcriptional regulator [Agrobacterium tumefaciens]
MVTISQLFRSRSHIAKTEKCTQKLLADLCHHFKVDHINYVSLAARPTIVTTYPPAWTKYYIENGGAVCDPLIIRTRRSILPQVWNELVDCTNSEREFFTAAFEHGIGKFGASTPVHGPHSEFAMVSINSQFPSSNWWPMTDDSAADLAYFALLLHHHVTQLPSSQRTRTTRLTPQEVLVLQWAAEGKTAWETAKIMSLSPTTVRFYLRNAADRLNVVTKTQAVATALREGLLI